MITDVRIPHTHREPPSRRGEVECADLRPCGAAVCGRKERPSARDSFRSRGRKFRRLPPDVNRTCGSERFHTSSSICATCPSESTPSDAPGGTRTASESSPVVAAGASRSRRPIGSPVAFASARTCIAFWCWGFWNSFSCRRSPASSSAEVSPPAPHEASHSIYRVQVLLTGPRVGRTGSIARWK